MSESCTLRGAIVTLLLYMRSAAKPAAFLISSGPRGGEALAGFGRERRAPRVGPFLRGVTAPRRAQVLGRRYFTPVPAQSAVSHRTDPGANKSHRRHRGEPYEDTPPTFAVGMVLGMTENCSRRGVPGPGCGRTGCLIGGRRARSLYGGGLRAAYASPTRQRAPFVKHLRRGANHTTHVRRGHRAHGRLTSYVALAPCSSTRVTPDRVRIRRADASCTTDRERRVGRAR